MLNVLPSAWDKKFGYNFLNCFKKLRFIITKRIHIFFSLINYSTWQLTASQGYSKDTLSIHKCMTKYKNLQVFSLSRLYGLHFPCLLKLTLQGWREDSVIKGTFCSSGGPFVPSTHIRQFTTACKSCSKGSYILSGLCRHPHSSETHTNTDF